MPAHEVFGRALLEAGFGPAFGLLGDANMMPMIFAIDQGMPYFAARHECGAVSMAAGYAMATGRVGFATITRGPGLANAITGLVSAARDHAPLVLFAGAAHTYDTLGPQSIDQDQLLMGTGVRSFTVPSAEYLCDSVGLARDLAAAERRPVVLNVPTDFLEATAPQQLPLEDRPRPELPPPPPTRVDPDIVERAARHLTAAHRPVILVGRGGVESAASVAELAQRTGALLANTLPVNGLFDDDPFCVGLVGGFAADAVRDMIAAADVVLCLGASLNDYTSDRGRLLAQATVIHVDHDTRALGRFHRPTLAICAKVEEAVRALATAVAESPRTDTGYRTREIAARISATRWGAHYADGSDEAGIDPRVLLRAVDERLSDQRRILVDVGAFSTFACQVLRSHSPGQLLPCFGFGSIGLALASTIGAAIGAPDETVVCVVGDGGLSLSLAELESVARIGAPLTIVVINDSAYGAEVHSLNKAGINPDLVRFPTIDFAQISATLGINAVRVNTPTDLTKLPDSLNNLPGPLLIDAHVTPNVIADKFQ